MKFDHGSGSKIFNSFSFDCLCQLINDHKKSFESFDELKKASNPPINKGVTTKNGPTPATANKASEITKKGATTTQKNGKATSTTQKKFQTSTASKQSTRKTTKGVPIVQTIVEKFRDIYRNLNKKESRLVLSMQTETKELRICSNSLPQIANLQELVDNTINVYDQIQTMQNFQGYNVSQADATGECEEIEDKIGTTNKDIQEFNALRECAATNASVLESNIKAIVEMSERHRYSIPPSVKFGARVSKGEDLRNDMLDFVGTIVQSVAAESELKDKLHDFRSKNCPKTTKAPTTTTVTPQEQVKCPVAKNLWVMPEDPTKAPSN